MSMLQAKKYVLYCVIVHVMESVVIDELMALCVGHYGVDEGSLQRA